MIDFQSKVAQLIEYDSTRPNEYELDEYYIDDGEKHPFVLLLPGGAYYSVSNYNEGFPFAYELNKKGISAFSLYYPCREKAAYPAPHEAVARALRYIFEHADEFSLDTTKYMIWGASAGAHLAGSYVTNFDDFTPELPKPTAMTLIYPVITMDDFTHKETRANILGPNDTPELRKKLSIEKNITPDTPPMYIWHGEWDGLVPIENSRVLVKALEENGVKYRFDLFPEVDHGVGLGVGLKCEGWIDRAVDFFWEVCK